LFLKIPHFNDFAQNHTSLKQSGLLGQGCGGGFFLGLLGTGLERRSLNRALVEDCLGDTFLFTTDFLGGVLKEDRVGSEMGSTEALPLPTTGV